MIDLAALPFLTIQNVIRNALKLQFRHTYKIYVKDAFNIMFYEVQYVVGNKLCKCSWSQCAYALTCIPNRPSMFAMRQ